MSEKCELCGEPMPENEKMFKFHGYSGDCPKPQLPQPNITEVASRLIRDVDIMNASKDAVHYYAGDKVKLAKDIDILVNYCAERGDFIRCSRCGEVMNDKDEAEGCRDLKCPLLG